MQTTTKTPPSVEILFLRHSKARVIDGFWPTHPDSKPLRTVDFLARFARRQRNS